MRRFLTSGRRRYALALLVIGVLALVGCQPLKEGVPDPSINPDSHDFGSVPLGSSSAPFRFTVTKSSFGAGESGRISTLVLGPFSVIDNTCKGAFLKRSETCIIDVMYTPTASGPQRGSLVVRDPKPDPGPPNADEDSASLLGTGT